MMNTPSFPYYLLVIRAEKFFLSHGEPIYLLCSSPVVKDSDSIVVLW